MPPRLLVTAWLACASLGCVSGVSEPAPLPVGHDVLFVGNSLTYVNDLPGMVAAMAQAGGETLLVTSLARADHALIDYLLDGSIQSLVARSGWKYVVMQQGPTTLPICRDTLVLAAQEIERLARRIEARSVMMMAWPTRARAFDFPKVHESAQMAAVTAGSQFAPAGDAWQLALASEPTLALYGSDGYHPAPLGTFLAALVIYEQVTGKDARELPPSASIAGPGVTATAATVKLLQDAAHSANVNAFSMPVPVWTPSVPPVPGIRC